MPKRRPKEPPRQSKNRASLDMSRSYVAVQFHSHIPIPFEDRIAQALDASGLVPWRSLLKEHPGLDLYKRIRLDPEELEEMIALARKRTPSYRPGSLKSHFAIIGEGAYDTVAVLRLVWTWPAVMDAWIVSPPPLPQVTANDDPWQFFQSYQNQAPQGVDAEYAWLVPGGDGAGTVFVDIEFDWRLDHEDIAGAGVTWAAGNAYGDGSNMDHGTAVLGVVLGQDNTVGIVGHAPATAASVLTPFGLNWPWYDLPTAILRATGLVGAGDVILLEQHMEVTKPSVQRQWDWPPVSLLVEKTWMPVEWDRANFDAIELAVATGVVVIEAAGNGGANLDTFAGTRGKQWLNPGSADYYGDSGAVMVGAASSSVPHARLDFSNHGSRVNCFAWGEDVFTASTNMTSGYQSDFGGTSSASAIVAGVVLQLQGIAQANLGRKCGPAEIRALLADATTGSASANPGTDLIGVMPSLRKILDTLHVPVDLYLRDFVGDTGDVHAESIGSSPDIIVQLGPAPADPQAEYGENSPSEDQLVPSRTRILRTGDSPLTLFLRTRNRGALPVAAMNAAAAIFVSPSSSLLDPNLWSIAGWAAFPDIPAGHVLTVSEPMTWADPPVDDDVTLIGLVIDGQDQAVRPLDLFPSWERFEQFIREQNNFAVRSLAIRTWAVRPRQDWVEFEDLRFLAAGASDKARRMSLEIGGDLPPGARLWLEASPEFAEVLGARTPWDEVDEKGQRVRIPLVTPRKQVLGEMVWPAGARHELRLGVEIPAQARRRAHTVWAGQRYEGRLVGRASWQLVPEAKEGGATTQASSRRPRPLK